MLGGNEKQSVSMVKNSNERNSLRIANVQRRIGNVI